MEPQQDQVEQLFEAALALDQQERSPFLKKIGEDNPELLPIVEELLDLDRQAGSFLQHAPFHLLDASREREEPTASMVTGGGAANGKSASET